jgi:FkbM family methyltransferase
MPNNLTIQSEPWVPWLRRKLRNYRRTWEYSFLNPPSSPQQCIRNNRTDRIFKYDIRNATDLAVLRQIYGGVDYDLLQLKRGSELFERYECILRDGKLPLIIDCGANIGASANYFLEKFPRASILAIEPDTDNFACLEQHCNSSQISCIRAAVSSRRGRGYIANPRAEPWAFQVEAGESGDIEFLTIADLLADAGPSAAPLIIKIDIEGFEKDLFAQNTEWVQLFPLLIIELHDWMLPREANSRNFLRVIADLDRDFVYHHENIFSQANNIYI